MVSADLRPGGLGCGGEQHLTIRTEPMPRGCVLASAGSLLWRNCRPKAYTGTQRRGLYVAVAFA